MPAAKTIRKAGNTTAKKTAKKVTADDVWAIIADIGKAHKELEKAHQKTEQAIDRMGARIDLATENFNKMSDRTDRILAETAQSIERMGARVDLTTEHINKMSDRVDRVTKNVGGLNQSMGELIETLFAANLGEKFDAYQYNLKRIYHRVFIYDDTNRLRSDIDILLSNTTVCMAVEVKRWLEKNADVDEHIRRMQLIRQFPPAEMKGKKLLGAIVGAVVLPEAREYAEKNGLFVLELTGEDVRLLTSQEGFQPKEW
jgi:Asp-tRNA(Asn)/Glu-tRNA(Gln) amidotransferase A subunit family amidase